MEEGEHRRRRVRANRASRGADAPDAGTPAPAPSGPGGTAARPDRPADTATRPDRVDYPATTPDPVGDTTTTPAQADDTDAKPAQADDTDAKPAQADDTDGKRPRFAAPDAEAPAGTARRPPLDRSAAEPYDLHTAMVGADDRDSERGLRGLVGGGSSQVGVVAAMRARDASRPTGADIAAAEANLTIVHRGWVPRDG